MHSLALHTFFLLIVFALFDYIQSSQEIIGSLVYVSGQHCTFLNIDDLLEISYKVRTNNPVWVNYYIRQ